MATSSSSSSYGIVVGKTACSWAIVVSHGIFFVIFAIVFQLFKSRVKAGRRKNHAILTKQQQKSEPNKNTAAAAAAEAATARADSNDNASASSSSSSHTFVATKQAKIQHLSLFALVCTYCAVTTLAFLFFGVAFARSYDEAWNSRVKELMNTAEMFTMFGSDSLFMLIVFLYIYQWLSFINAQLLKFRDKTRFGRVFGPLCVFGGIGFFVLELLLGMPSYFRTGDLTNLAAILFAVVYGSVDLIAISVMIAASIYIILAMKKAAASTNSASRTDILQQQRKRLRFSMMHQIALIVLLIANITGKPLGFVLSVLTPVGFYGALLGRIPDWFFFGYLIFWYMHSFPRVFGLASFQWYDSIVAITSDDDDDDDGEDDDDVDAKEEGDPRDAPADLARHYSSSSSSFCKIEFGLVPLALVTTQKANEEEQQEQEQRQALQAQTTEHHAEETGAAAAAAETTDQ